MDVFFLQYPLYFLIFPIFSNISIFLKSFSTHTDTADCYQFVVRELSGGNFHLDWNTISFDKMMKEDVRS